MCSSYLILNGKSTEVLTAFTASEAQWRLGTLCVVFEQLCKLQAFMQNDFCLEVFATSKDNPYHIESMVRMTSTSGGTHREHDASLRWWMSIDGGVHSAVARRRSVARVPLWYAVTLNRRAVRSSLGKRRVPGQGGISRKVTESTTKLKGTWHFSCHGSDPYAAHQVGCHRQRPSGSQRFHDNSWLRWVLRRPKRDCGRTEQTMRTSHHPLACKFMERFEADLREESLVATCPKFRRTCLLRKSSCNEFHCPAQASEGVHCQSRKVKKRTPASSMPWIPAS